MVRACCIITKYCIFLIEIRKEHPPQVIPSLMKWINHETVTGAIMFGATGGDIPYTIAAAVGGIFPDMAEGKPPEDMEKMKTWKKGHRKWSHWFVPYMALAIIVFLAYIFTGSARMTAGIDIVDSIIKGNPLAALPFLGWFAMGCVFHIAEDSLCGHVPSLNPRKRTGVRFFYVGSRMEYILSFSFVGIFLLIVGLL